MSVETPEEMAAREGLPVVRALPFDLMRVATGHSMIVDMADGGRACLRLFDPEEFLTEQHAAADKYGADTHITMAKAIELTKPLSGAR